MISTGRKYRIRNLVWGIVVSELIFWLLFILGISVFGSISGGDKLLFRQPEYIWLLTLIIPISFFIVLFRLMHEKQTNVLPDKVYRSLYTEKSRPPSFIRYFLLRNAFVFLIFALAQPVYGKKKVKGSAESLELVVCLDISNSMNTKDISPEISRLEIAKRSMIQLINNLHGEKIGLVLFANHAFVHLPLTRDYSSAKIFINDIETRMISSQGTNIDDALRISMEMFSEEKTGKGILLITDGENHESKPDNILSELKEARIDVILMGIGTRNGGAIPKDPNRPELGYKSDAMGRTVISKVDEAFIRYIAAKSGGKAYVNNDEFPDLSDLLTQIKHLQRRKINNLEFDVKQERYQVPLILSLICWLLFVTGIGGKRNNRNQIQKIA